MSELQEYVKRMYGSQAKMATSLGVTANTVTNWLHRNPRQMLKHADKIVAQCPTTYTELTSEVMYHAEQLKTT